MSEFLDRTIEREIDSINDHLPKKLVSLAALLRSEKPCYETKSGDTSAIRSEEIQFLSEDIPERFHEEFMLPIVILRRTDLGPGIHSVAGGKPELFLIQRLLGYVDLRWDELLRWNAVNRLARPQVQVVRKRLPSATCVGFTSSEE